MCKARKELKGEGSSKADPYKKIKQCKVHETKTLGQNRLDATLKCTFNLLCKRHISIHVTVV